MEWVSSSDFDDDRRRRCRRIIVHWSAIRRDSQWNATSTTIGSTISNFAKAKFDIVLSASPLAEIDGAFDSKPADQDQ